MDNILIPQEVLDSLNHVKFYIQYMSNPKNNETPQSKLNDEESFNQSWWRNRNALLNYSILPDLYDRREDICNTMKQLNIDNFIINKCKKYNISNSFCM